MIEQIEQILISKVHDKLNNTTNLRFKCSYGSLVPLFMSQYVVYLSVYDHYIELLLLSDSSGSPITIPVDICDPNTNIDKIIDLIVQKIEKCFEKS